MSRFKNEVAHLQAHVKTLRLGAGALFVVALLLGFGWWSAPKSLTIHVPPDLRSGSTRKWWDVPPESVYAFSFYIWQQVQRWPTNGEEDYPRNLRALSAYFTPSCRAFLQQDYEYRRASGELRQRVRGIYEIPGRGYGDDPATRVKVLSDRDWIVTLDVSADEYYGSEQVKRALVRYPIKVVRLDIDPERNPFGLALDCYASAPQRIEPPPTPTQAGPVALSALAGVLLILGVVPASQAVEILRWERLPLPVPLVVGQERVVFIDRNVRVGVPASLGDHLRVQRAGGAIYLRASEPIPPTRLQLQDVESGALILLDIAAEPAKDGQAPLEPQVARTSRPMRPQTNPFPGAKRRYRSC
ncbi:hypothetical protein G6F24_013197 [Rhizopus arrhizus]|nr:hypothetical protein G6F24_013197 [Rhizopus arrhizus]